MNPVKFHAMALAPDANPDYRIYYLHLSTYPGSTPVSVQPAKAGCPTTLPLAAGTHVEVGCEIALSGDAGVSGHPHLHFEVQKRVLPLPIGGANPQLIQLHCTDGTWPHAKEMMCVPVDPYGWAGPTTNCKASSPVGDKYACLTGVTSTRLWLASPSK
jgi:hypothetical protein